MSNKKSNKNKYARRHTVESNRIKTCLHCESEFRDASKDASKEYCDRQYCIEDRGGIQGIEIINFEN